MILLKDRHNLRQRYINVIYESQVNCHLCPKYEGLFNLSANYKEDSDFTSIYWTDTKIYWDDIKENDSTLLDIYSTKKNNSKFAVINISNCQSRSGREKLIAQLKQFIDIDMYGNCGTLQCPKDQNFRNFSSCREYVAKQYKFFLAFENSLCDGYITEKFFDVFKYPIIPVVFGLGNHSYYIPKSAYINALDFKNAKHLANYMIYLSNNKSAYNSYFIWKKYIKIDSRNLFGSGFLCEMCIKLHLEDNIGYSEKKHLENLNKTYGLYENCKEFDEKNFKFKKLTKDIYSYYMTEENLNWYI